jgi:hypothetical protein
VTIENRVSSFGKALTILVEFRRGKFVRHG